MKQALQIKPSDYDVFRNDLLDIPEQECTNEIECAVGMILDSIGENPEREGLLRTPEPCRQNVRRTHRRLPRRS